ncbi:tetratricopeptide repeat protein [Polynucleobacter antarcticus]|uniref:Uncharacterized protein n=2 Tax=Polynucleobacter antarcticus TaxID=1743162 RepID=A0A6M9PIT0_9BURK|nr:hypothetical protein DCO16_06925 [Polynucleobacter antarcticus]
MKAPKLLNILASIFATAFLLTSQMTMAEPSLSEVYKAVQSGQLAKADSMMKEVLVNHPNSAKANYVAAELYLKQGQVEVARNYFIKAQNLAPGLPFAQAESVQKLQTQLASTAVASSASPNLSPDSIVSNPIFWGLIAILVVGVIIVMKQRKREATQMYSASSTPHPGTSGNQGGPTGQPNSSNNPNGFSGPGTSAAPMATAAPVAPTAGMGSGLMGSLATGAALGAGMYAGQALAGSLFGNNNNANGNSAGNQVDSQAGNSHMNQVGGPASLDPNFGVRDGSSWDDNSASSWDDSGGDFMSDV